jgi:acyl-coenzyme A thioesterase PaaI-like protein
VEGDDDVEARARAGRAIRDVGHALVGHHAQPALIDEVATTLDGLTVRLDEGEPRQRVRPPYEERWQQPIADGDRMHTYDDRPFSGRASPWGLDLSVHRHGQEIEAVLTLRAAHEGAPARSHGGIVAALFDDVFGYVLDVIQEAAFTGELTVRYERPTPLHRPIACRGRLARRDGRKLLVEGELVDLETDGQPVVARGRGLFIAVDPSVFEVGTQQLPAPPDEG